MFACDHPNPTEVPNVKNAPCHALLATLALGACLLATTSQARPSAQAVVHGAATVVAPIVRPSPVIAPDLSRSVAVATPIAGRWSSSETDKETGVTETLLIEFRTDGSYTTQLVESHFKSPRFHGSGRYAVVDASASGFTLVIQRRMDDPESDKSAAKETQRITWVDKDTLRAADGSVIRRAR